MKIPLLVIFGPTSVGKTKVAIALAKRYKGEIVSADSRQVYCEMNIGTDKPTLEERDGIAHHLIDVVNPDEPFNLSDYVELAWNVIHDIHQRGKLPILAGSAGLYIRAVTEGYALSNAGPDENLRKQLLQRIETEGTLPLYEELCRLDPEGAKTLDSKNPRRLIRFYEIYAQTGKMPSEIWKLRDPRAQAFAPIKIGLIRSREKLHERIVARVDEQEKRGLIFEVKGLLQKYPRDLKAFQTHSYQEVFPFFDGQYDWDEAKRLIVAHTFAYARRQWIWFKREKGVHWEEAEPFGDWGTIAARLQKIIKI